MASGATDTSGATDGPVRRRTPGEAAVRDVPWWGFLIRHVYLGGLRDMVRNFDYHRRDIRVVGTDLMRWLLRMYHNRLTIDREKRHADVLVFVTEPTTSVHVLNFFTGSRSDREVLRAVLRTSEPWAVSVCTHCTLDAVRKRDRALLKQLTGAARALAERREGDDTGTDARAAVPPLRELRCRRTGDTALHVACRSRGLVRRLLYELEHVYGCSWTATNDAGTPPERRRGGKGR